MSSHLPSPSKWILPWWRSHLSGSFIFGAGLWKGVAGRGGGVAFTYSPVLVRVLPAALNSLSENWQFCFCKNNTFSRKNPPKIPTCDCFQGKHNLSENSIIGCIIISCCSASGSASKATFVVLFRTMRSWHTENTAYSSTSPCNVFCCVIFVLHAPTVSGTMSAYMKQ